MNKNEIRDFTLKIRNRLHHYFVAQKSQIIVNNLSCVLNNKRYKNILIFMEMKNEINISNITNK